MKRPVAIYFVAFWCLLGMLVQTGFLRDWVRANSDLEISPETWKSLTGAVGILIIWHIVRLIQLKAFNRWLSTVFFTWWTLVMIWNLSIIISSVQIRARLLVVILSMCALNLACVWYLSRKGFRQFAVEFSTEREKEKHSRQMQKIAEKRILDKS